MCMYHVPSLSRKLFINIIGKPDNRTTKLHFVARQQVVLFVDLTEELSEENYDLFLIVT